MSEPAVRIENISKSYKLLHRQKGQNDSIISAFAGGLKDVFKRCEERNSTEEFWALKDINLELNKGDRIGIIGRNGAGKSTLLKILSRIVKPTTGRMEYDGRMASLLEVGTGFHGDLSGRENIYLNGSILGMSKKEIDAKFEEIVAFSEVEKFLDTPVKRYSSGMYVRLAFAVAAHLESEILIVDEVLAVGDVAFQKKCLGKMKEISGQGKTILFVSHNMAAIQNLCNKGMILSGGRVKLGVSEAQHAIKEYMKDSSLLGKTKLINRTDREGEGQIRFENIALVDADGTELNGVHSGQEINIVVETLIKQSHVTNISLAITFYSDEGIEMLTFANHIADKPFDELHQKQKLVCNIKKFPLTRGEYVANVSIYKDSILQDYIREGFALTVYEGDFYGNGRILPGNQPSVLVDYTWKIQ
ncbi:MAG: ABC transporter ATP-binding protein [Bacteroidia bacterium]|nr:ABC transporter ATP-binding protein [Bacteroidia bacterium]